MNVPVGIPEEESARLVPKLPAVWPGYALAGAFFVTELYAAGMNSEGDARNGATLLVAILGWSFCLRCIYRIHDVLSQVEGWVHPISPGRAVGMMFVPLYNFYWVFKWAAEIARFVNWRTQAKTLDSGLVGSAFLVATLVGRIIDGALGLLLICASLAYVNRALKRAFAAPSVPLEMARSAAAGPLGL